MLRKTLLMPSVFALSFALFTAPVVADDYTTDITVKLGRGMANTTLGWMELFKNAYNEPAYNGPAYIPVGVVTGIYHTLGRTVVGLVDVVAFLFPSDSLVAPTYVWEDFDHETSYGLPPRRRSY